MKKKYIYILLITTVDIFSTLNMCEGRGRGRGRGRGGVGTQSIKVNPIVYNKATHRNLLTYTLICMFIQGYLKVSGHPVLILIDKDLEMNHR